MDPALISMGVGLLGGVFGGGRPRTPGYVKDAYKLENAIRRRGLDLYDNTDVAANDAEAVRQYSELMQQQGMKLLGNYDARMAGAGFSPGKGDTKRGRSQAQIAGDVSGRVGEFGANLAASRPQRQAALLPGASPGTMLQAGAMADGAAQAEYANQLQGLMGLADLGASLMKKPARNDRSAALLSTSRPWWLGLMR
jgi:hypothetical protein